MKPATRRVITSLVVVGVVAVGTAAYLRSRKPKAPKVQYRTQAVDRGDVRSTVSATGVLQPWKTIDIKSNVGGRIDLLAVDLGDMVHKGQLIAKIDPTDSMTALNQARANFVAAQAKVQQSRDQLNLQNANTRQDITSAEQQLQTALANLAKAQQQARVQPALTNADIQQARANLESAQAAVREWDQATAPQSVTAATSNVESAQTSYDNATRNLARLRGLVAQGFVAQQQVDDAVVQVQSAKTQLDQARQKLSTLKQENQAQRATLVARRRQAEQQLVSSRANSVQIPLRRRDVASAQAAVAQAQAAVAAARAGRINYSIRAADIASAQSSLQSSKAALNKATINMGYTTISAPRDGIVLQKLVEQGTIVASSSGSFGTGQALVQLGDISHMFVLTQVDETDIAQVAVGQAVDITFDAYPGEIFEGKVTRIDPQAKIDQNVTTIPVTVEVQDPDIRLKPSMSANCDFITNDRKNVVKVPNEAVKEDNGQSYVEVMVAGKPQRRNVETGIQGQSDTEILSGLKEGEIVVTQTIQEEEAPPATGGSALTRNPFQPRGGGGRGGGGR
jgi:HlyD family secretion protein